MCGNHYGTSAVNVCGLIRGVTEKGLIIVSYIITIIYAVKYHF